MEYGDIATVKTEGGPTSFNNTPGEKFVYNQGVIDRTCARLCDHAQDDRRQPLQDRVRPERAGNK